MRTKSTGDGEKDPEDVKSESFVNDDNEIKPVVKKRKDSAFDSIMLELKLMDENKTNRAGKFLIPFLFLLLKRIVLLIENEPHGVMLTIFLYNLQQPTQKNTCEIIPKIYPWVHITHAKKDLDEFYSAGEEKQPTREKNWSSNKKQTRGRSET